MCVDDVSCKLRGDKIPKGNELFVNEVFTLATSAS